MTLFEKEAFQKFQFKDQDIKRYFENSLRDLKIAKEDSFFTEGANPSQKKKLMIISAS
jgi:hypothetical protein